MRKGYLRLLTHKRFETCATIFVACSGGPDSLALLRRMLVQYSIEKIVVMFINHHTDESMEGAMAVEKFTNEWKDIGKRVICRTFLSIPTGTCPSEVEWAYARRDIYKACLASYEDSIIVTGHHLDDAVEEYLINWSKRGSSGTIKYNYPNKDIFRPMLWNKKEQIIEYCQGNGIKYVDSSGGKDLRNKIRRSSIITDINELMGTNLDTIVRKKVETDYELSKVESLGSFDRGRAS